MQTPREPLAAVNAVVPAQPQQSDLGCARAQSWQSRINIQSSKCCHRNCFVCPATKRCAGTEGGSKKEMANSVAVLLPSKGAT